MDGGLGHDGSDNPWHRAAGRRAPQIGGSLFVFGFGYDTGDDIAQHRVDVFTQEYPDVDISFSESGYDAQTLLAALSGGDPPDIVNLPRNEVGTYIARGVLSPLDDCVAQQGIDLSQYYDAGLEQVTVDGSVYAMPEFFNTRVWILNNHVFDAAGIDPASVDLSDWDGLASSTSNSPPRTGATSHASGWIPSCRTSCRCGPGAMAPRC